MPWNAFIWECVPSIPGRVLVSGLDPVHKHWLRVLPCEFKPNNTLDEYNPSTSSISQVQVWKLAQEAIPAYLPAVWQGTGWKDWMAWVYLPWNLSVLQVGRSVIRWGKWCVCLAKQYLSKTRKGAGQKRKARNVSSVRGRNFISSRVLQFRLLLQSILW